MVVTASILMFFSMVIAFSILSTCDDVDPNNQNSILIGQLHLLEQQLEVQRQQLNVQSQQIELQRLTLEESTSSSGWIRMFEYSAFTLVGYLVILLAKVILLRLRRCRAVALPLNLEMPRVDSSPSTDVVRSIDDLRVERVRLLTQLKSPRGSIYYDDPHELCDVASGS